MSLLLLFLYCCVSVTFAQHMLDLMLYHMSHHMLPHMSQSDENGNNQCFTSFHCFLMYDRPKKKRRTKGTRELREGDPRTADGFIIRDIVHQTGQGSVEEELHIPVWLNQPTAPLQPQQDPGPSHIDPTPSHINDYDQDLFPEDNPPDVTRSARVWVMDMEFVPHKSD